MDNYALTPEHEAWQTETLATPQPHSPQQEMRQATLVDGLLIGASLGAAAVIGTMLQRKKHN